MRLKTLDEIIRDGDERDLVEVMNKAFSAARDSRRSFDEKWAKLYSQYRFKPPGADYPWQADLIMPLSFSTVESMVPALVASTPKFRVDATTDEMIAVARKLEDWYDYLTLESTTQFRTKTRAGVKSSSIYGLGIFKTYYRLDIQLSYRSMPREIQITEQADGFIKTEPVTSAGRVMKAQPITAANNPDFDNISVFDFYPSPEATNIQGAEYVIHQAIVPLRVVRALVDNGEWDERILDELEKEEHNPTSQDASYAKYRLAQEMGESFATEAMELIRPVLVREMWAEPGLRLTVLNERHVAALSDEGRTNPYSHGRKPFVAFADTEDDQSFWGISTVEAISGLQHEINSMRNQRADATNMAMSPMFAVRDSEIDIRQLVARPGGLITVQSQWPLNDVIFELPRPVIPNISWEETNFLKQTLNEVVGMSDYQRGMDPSTRDTATEVNAKVQGGAARGTVRQENFDSGITDLAYQWLHLGAQFWQDKRSLPRAPTTADESPFFEMGPDDFQLGMKIHVKPASVQETDLERRQQATNRLEILLGSEVAQEIMGVEGRTELIRNYLEADGVTDVGRYLAGAPEAKELDTLRKQAEAAQLSAVPVQVQQAMEQPPPPPGGPEGEGGGAPPGAGAPPPQQAPPPEAAPMNGGTPAEQMQNVPPELLVQLMGPAGGGGV